MNRFALFLASLVPAVGGLWMATEKFAALVAYDPAFLGSSLIIGGTHIYPPWAFVTWYFRYQRYVPELFSTVTPYSFGGFVLCLLMLFLSDRKRSSRPMAVPIGPVIKTWSRCT